eukprot:CAMPEP_0170565718 /NCGR_PEP_ID=MMETSP0211-20121228/79369_1 /TAXON_ID=311385 /ORGANISM="Pseudokeronopsis sp., Strain OXSARD2" /LENGTH=58 /DNA_ID=CAMNT_0010886671 /DNA_START=1978 /DNA_END=2151 /DNA_ORIENTATION=-
MSLQRFKENLAKSLVQSKDVGNEDGNNLEIGDLLKSFEEHSAYAREANKVVQVEDKIV